MQKHKYFLSTLKGLLIFTSIFLVSCGGSALPPQGDSDLPSLPEDATIYRGGWETCGQYRVAFDNRARLTEIERNTLREAGLLAIERWNAVLGFPIFVEVEDAVCVENDITIRLSDGPGLAFAIYDPQMFGTFCGCAISVDQNAVHPKIIEHELGHCLGLNHSSSPDSIMYKQAKGGDFSKEMVDLVANASNPTLLGNPEVLVPSCHN